LRVFIEGTIASDELAATDGTLFDIAARHMKLAFDYAAVMAGLSIGSPVGVLVSVGDTSNASPF
jgi:hypothetical protein